MQETVRQLTVFYDICDATRRFLGSGSNHWLCFHLMPRIRLTCPRPRSLESRLSGCEESCRRCWAALPQPAAARPDAGAGVAESRDGAGLAGESPLSRLVIDALRFEIQARRRPLARAFASRDVRRGAVHHYARRSCFFRHPPPGGVTLAPAHRHPPRSAPAVPRDELVLPPPPSPPSSVGARQAVESRQRSRTRGRGWPP